MLLEQTVYLGTDNVIALALRSDIEIISHVSTTQDDNLSQTHEHPIISRCILRIKPIVGDSSDTQVIIDSDIDSGSFDFVTDTNILVMRLGGNIIKIGRHVTIWKFTTIQEIISNGAKSCWWLNKS